MTSAEREALFVRYEAGPALLRAALEHLPDGALRWRPAPGQWSPHEVVHHCADSETNSAMRIRYLVGEDRPAIQGYDQDRWARDFDYHRLPLEPALRQVETVRAWTALFIRSLPDDAWARTGTHSEHPGAYRASDWLRIYAEHLEIHARQLERIHAAWQARAPGR